VPQGTLFEVSVQKGVQMDNRSRMKAIMRTLAGSVKSGLNASLNPADCRFLIRHFTGKKNPVDRIVDGITDMAHEAINAFGADIRKDRR
jgi:hypothetical protein